jgi:hypothetical protein
MRYVDVRLILIVFCLTIMAYPSDTINREKKFKWKYDFNQSFFAFPGNGTVLTHKPNELAIIRLRRKKIFLELRVCVWCVPGWIDQSLHLSCHIHVMFQATERKRRRKTSHHQSSNKHWIKRIGWENVIHLPESRCAFVVFAASTNIHTNIATANIWEINISTSQSISRGPPTPLFSLHHTHLPLTSSTFVLTLYIR